jgi:hypothetical protein
MPPGNPAIYPANQTVPNEIRNVGTSQRLLLRAVLLNIVFSVGLVATSSLPWVNLFVALASLLVLPVYAYAFWKLGRALGKAPVLLLIGLIMGQSPIAGVVA